jgi:transketolase
MGDGEQQKGQIQEAREFAFKYGLNIVAVIDANGQQSSGSVQEIMPQFLCEKYEASGWRVAETDGHDIGKLYQVFESSTGPMALIAHTVMGKGFPFIENNFRYHGNLLTETQFKEAVRALAQSPEEVSGIATLRLTKTRIRRDISHMELDTGERIEYSADVQTDMRSAFGNALADVAVRNKNRGIAVLDCDLLSALKLDKLKEACPGSLIECGIAEQNACTTAAAMAKRGCLTILANFSVFAIAECYSQQRTADINQSGLKVFCTHAGLDVGEDGVSHQSLDYLSLLSNFRHCKVMVAADANHSDLLTRTALSYPETTFVIMGRSKIPTILDEQGDPFYGKNYHFVYGEADWLRRGKDISLLVSGNMVFRAIRIASLLEEKKISTSVLNVSCPFSLDAEKLTEASKANIVIAFEDHNASNGLGSAVSMFFSQRGITRKLYCKGVTGYGLSASPQVNYEAQGLDEISMATWIKEIWEESL